MAFQMDKNRKKKAKIKEERFNAQIKLDRTVGEYTEYVNRLKR